MKTAMTHPTFVPARLRRWFGVFATILSLGVMASANASIPAVERSFLLEFHAQMQPQDWRFSQGWGGASGTECSWFGVICDAGGDHVVELALADNNMAGQIPASIENMSQLRVLDLSANFFSGPFPRVSKLSQLEVIKLRQWPDAHAMGSPGFTGAIPALTQLSNLQVFDVQTNSLSGTIPSLAGLKQLRHFDLDRNLLSGSIPPLQGLDNLQYFVASRNQLTGRIPSIDGLGSLVYFYAVYNALDGMDGSLAGLGKLEELNVGFNRIEGQLPSLGGAPRLKMIFLSSNKFSGIFPQLTSSNAALRGIYIAENQFSGALPSLAQLPNLRSFFANDNLFSGEIPAFGEGPLDNYGVGSNLLTGPIPSLLPVRRMNFFDVGDNQLTGSIPDLAQLVQLYYFEAEHNLLTGHLPPLPRTILRFAVGWNRLSGPPPLPGPAAMNPDESSLCPNYFDPIDSSRWDSATGTSPWHQTCTAIPDELFRDGFEVSP